MRTRIAVGLALAVLAAGLWGLGNQPASAEFIEMDSPSLAFPGDYPKAESERVMAMLNADKYKFLGGSAINSISTLKYQGDAQALSFFLEDLAKCSDLKIHISFAKPSNPGDALGEADWLVHHTGSQNDFHIRVNLDSKKIDIAKLYLPDIHTAKAVAEK